MSVHGERPTFHLDLVLYQAITSWEGSESVFSETERLEFAATLKRYLREHFTLTRFVNPPYQKLGRRIRNGRAAIGMTQKQVCERLSVWPDAVVQWEKGRTKPNESNMRELEELFGVVLMHPTLGARTLKDHTE